MALNRRGFLLGASAAAVGGAALAPKVKGSVSPSAAVSPPGSGGFARLRTRCTGCNLCVSLCPTHVLKTAALEYGLSGVMMPVMDFKAGACDPACTRCGDVCPQGAIQPFTRAEKPRIRIGRAVVADNCLRLTKQLGCGSCVRHCPYEAIQAEVNEKTGAKKGADRPRVKEDRCVGCGACAFACPAQAIRIRCL